MLSVQRVAKAAVIELMANRSLRRLATLLSVTALPEVIRMMSSRRAPPHQGSGWVTPPTQEAEYMAATVFPSASDHTALAFGLGPYMTGWRTPVCHFQLLRNRHRLLRRCDASAEQRERLCQGAFVIEEAA